MNGQIIPEETEKSIEVKQENATFLVIGDKAYTSEIIEEYNRNAEAKTEDFNTNVENKTASYNSNAADRTTAFNNNYDDKVDAFNSNANAQTEEFDAHVLMQTNTFNNNASSTIANYNSNAEQKTNEFNQNALSYQEGIDANKKHIINVSNELERVKNDVLETGTDTDTYIHLEDSAMAEYQELNIDGVCEQNTTSIDNGDEYDSPSPEHPQPIATIENSLKITSCNKNLTDDKTIHSSIGASGKISYNLDGYNYIGVSKLLEVQPNETYTLTFVGYENVGLLYCGTFDKNGNFIERLDLGSKVRTITTGDNVYYIFPYMYDNNGAFTTIGTDIQLEIGNTKSPFEQHLETQIEANLPEGEFIGKINDTYKDTLKVEYNEDDGQYHLNLYKSVGKVVLDGNTIINNVDATLSETTRVGMWGILTSKPSTSYMLCLPLSNYFIGKYIWLSDEVGMYVTNNDIVFRANKNIIGTTENEVKTWLSTNNVEVYYALAKPYVVDIGIVDIPITYNEITNLFTDSDLIPTINAKYYRNFITTIQNLQVNEKALKQELVDINARLTALESAQTSTIQESEVVE